MMLLMMMMMPSLSQWRRHQWRLLSKGGKHILLQGNRENINAQDRNVNFIKKDSQDHVSSKITWSNTQMPVHLNVPIVTRVTNMIAASVGISETNMGRWRKSFT